MKRCRACRNVFDHRMLAKCPHCGKTTTTIQALLAENRRLRAQVTKLQEHNNAEVERRRKLAERIADQFHLFGLCCKALERWGERSQLAMCAEECAELGAEIMRVLRGRGDHVEPMIREAADVYITTMQLRLVNTKLFDATVREKLDRLAALLEAPHADA